jgi:MSHA pilin protein MshA
MIELVVVIVILGILAAFALPRFMGLESQARIAALNGMAGSIRSAANMAHGVWLANGNVSPFKVDGQTVTIVNGYPDGPSLLSLIQDTSGFTTTPTGTTAVTFTPIGAPAATAAKCSVKYTQAAPEAAPDLTVQAPATLQASC